MNLGIDLGTSYTKLGYIKMNKFINLAAESKIPTAITYLPSRNELYCGNLALRLTEPGANTARFFKLELKRNPEFILNSFSLEDILREYFNFLKKQYVQDQLDNVESISISVPNYFGLNARKLLLDAVKEVFGTETINLLPEPVAALLGYNYAHSDSPLEGDILIIDIGGGTTDFSFVNHAYKNQQITIESQFQIGQDAFSGSEVDRGILHNILFPAYQIQTGKQLPINIIKEKNRSPREKHLFNEMMRYAEKLKIELSEKEYSDINIADFYAGHSLQFSISPDFFINKLQTLFLGLKTYFNESVKSKAVNLGLYQNSKWQLDYVLLLGGASQTRGIQDLIAELCPGVTIISPDDRDLNVVKGLCTQNKNTNLSIKCIYPFNFYIEKFDYNRNDFLLEKIPFDTSNLELDIKSRYKLTSFPADSNYNLAPNPDNALFRIYEVAEEDPNAHVERFKDQDLILQIESPRELLPDNINVYLNMAASTLESDMSDQLLQVSSSKKYFKDLQVKQKEFLTLMGKYRFYNKQLKKDFANHLEHINQHAQRTHQNHDETTFYKLISLLQLYSGK